MLKIIKKADIILFIILLLIGLGLSYASFAMGSKAGNKVQITQGGKVYGTYDLSEDQVIQVDIAGHLNKIIIKDGKVQMMEADCHNQLCVKQGSISKANESIICLPNRVVVSIIGEEAEYDALSG